MSYNFAGFLYNLFTYMMSRANLLETDAKVVLFRNPLEVLNRILSVLFPLTVLVTCRK